MVSTIAPHELSKWVPGELLCASDAQGWSGVGVRGYHYAPQDVEVPPLSDYVVVSYRRGTTTMERRFEGTWTRTHCAPDDISLLTRSQASHWHWTAPIEVSHAYLSARLVANVAEDALERAVTDIRLHDILKLQDPIVTRLVDAMTAETQNQSLGGALYAESLATQLTIHLLRNYCSVSYRDRASHDGLSTIQQREVLEWLDARLHENISLEAMAEAAGLGVWTFGRRFRVAFGVTPHAFVNTQRLRRAQALLRSGRLAVKEVAAACGFADQAHLTRAFQVQFHTTPAAWRRGVAGS
jgi:AraC family transcriptional regulator